MIKACENRIRLGPGEYPAIYYPWSFKEVAGVDELIEAFRHGNWSVRTGFVLGGLAFVEQVSGGNEWLALKKDAGEWKPFESFSFYRMLESKGDGYCRNFISSLQKTPWWNLTHPAQPISGLERLRDVTRMVENITGGKQEFSTDFAGGVYIKQDDSANTGLFMRKNPDFESGLCRLEFQGYIRRMGVYMSSDGMREMHTEIGQLTKLLEILEQEPVVVAEEEMTQWAKELGTRQPGQAITDAAERDPQIDPTMGMT